MPLFGLNYLSLISSIMPLDSIPVNSKTSIIKNSEKKCHKEDSLTSNDLVTTSGLSPSVMEILKIFISSSAVSIHPSKLSRSSYKVSRSPCIRCSLSKRLSRCVFTCKVRGHMNNSSDMDGCRSTGIRYNNHKRKYMGALLSLEQVFE